MTALPDSFFVGRPGGGGSVDLLGDAKVWRYADAAEAVASGHAWGDGDTIECDDSAHLQFWSSLSTATPGLLPAVIRGRRVASVELVTELPGGTDPRTVDGWVDASTGVEDTDYSVTLGSGVTTLAKLTTAGQCRIDGPKLTSSDTLVCAIMHGVTIAGTQSGDRAAPIHRLYVTAGSFSGAASGLRTAHSSSNISVDVSDSGVALPSDTLYWLTLDADGGSPKWDLYGGPDGQRGTGTDTAGAGTPGDWGVLDLIAGLAATAGTASFAYRGIALARLVLA